MNILESLRTELVHGNAINIVFIGDSITSTEWVHPNWREIIEYVLKEDMTTKINDWKIPSWNLRCFNCGFDGSTTDDILRMMDSKIMSLKPNIAIYLENTNEIHYDATPEQHKKNVEAMIEKLSETCSYIIIANSICGNDAEYNKTLSKYANIVREITFTDNIIFVDTFSEYSKYELNRLFTVKSLGNEALGLRPGDIDFVHPNQLGNAYIAKIILEKAFGIEFNPEKYIEDTASGLMYPRY